MLSVLTKTQDKIAGLWELIGNTPLMEIRYRYKNGPEQRILAKMEYHNHTGSIKDRMALYIIQKAYEEGALKPGDTIVEATSGNTGISFAAIGKNLGHHVRIIMPDWLSKERKDIIRSLGAEIILVSKEAGGFLKSIAMAEQMQHDEHIFLPRQFENKFNAEAHEKTTGREIGHALLLDQIRPYAFIAGVGTGGTIMGVGKYLRSIYPDIRLHPLEPAESPTLSTKSKNGSHRIQGISDEFIPAILDLDQLDKIIAVNDGDAILMAQKLAMQLGLAVGISSGANLLGAIKVQQQSESANAVITVFPDSNKKYLSTDLMNVEPIIDGYLTPDIQLINAQPLRK